MIQDLLKEMDMSVHQCAKLSGIPYTTLLELVKGKRKIEKCTAETVYKLARTLRVSMEELLEGSGESEGQVAFETFKSDVCHRVKEKGDLEFIIETLERDDVSRYWRMKRYQEAYYTLGMLDYLSRENQLPLCDEYADIRNTSLKEPIFPRDIALMAKMDSSLDYREQAMEEAIPEFKRFNIIERGVRDVC